MKTYKKPAWSDAPEWANYLAMDKNGEWWWHEDKPTKTKCGFTSHKKVAPVVGSVGYKELLIKVTEDV